MGEVISVIIGVSAALIVAGVIIGYFVRKKKGKTGCSDCSGCSYCKDCNKSADKKPQNKRSS